MRSTHNQEDELSPSQSKLSYTMLMLLQVNTLTANYLSVSKIEGYKQSFIVRPVLDCITDFEKSCTTPTLLFFLTL